MQLAQSPSKREITRGGNEQGSVHKFKGIMIFSHIFPCFNAKFVKEVHGREVMYCFTVIHVQIKGNVWVPMASHSNAQLILTN